MTLLEDDADVRPRLVDPLAECHDRVVARQRGVAGHREHEENGEGRGEERRRHPPRPPPRLSAKIIAEAMARIAPSRPTMNFVWPRSTTSPGMPYAISSGTSSEAAITSASGAIEKVRSIRAATSGPARGRRSAAG